MFLEVRRVSAAVTERVAAEIAPELRPVSVHGAPVEQQGVTGYKGPEAPGITQVRS